MLSLTTKGDYKMFPINMSGLRLLAKSGAPVTIRLIPSIKTEHQGRYFLTTTTTHGTGDFQAAGVLVSTKGGEDLRYYKNITLAVREVEKILVDLSAVLVLTGKAGEVYQAEQGTRY